MRKTKMEILSQKELVFCRLVAQGNTPIQAAKEAGYAKGAYGTRLMQKEKILAEISRQHVTTQESTLAVAENDEILKFLTSIMRGDEYEERKDSIIKDRMRAAELLGKRLKLFESLEDENDSKVVIIDDISTRESDRRKKIESREHLPFSSDV